MNNSSWSATGDSHSSQCKRPTKRAVSDVFVPNVNHLVGSRLLAGLNRLRLERKFCDVTLKVNNVGIPAHKNVLCAYSAYFNIMFNGHFKESKEEIIPLNDLDENVVEAIINYLYTAKIDLDEHNIESVLDTANFLQIDLLQEECCLFLLHDLNETNCLYYIIIAGKYNSECVRDKAIRVIAQNYFKLYGKSDLLDIQIHEFVKLLANNEFKLYPKNYIFDLIMRWVSKVPEDRLRHLSTLLENFVPQQEINKQSENRVREIISDSSCNNWLKEFKHIEYRDVIFEYERTREGYCFLLYGKEYMSRVKIPESHLESSCLAHDNSIYLSGGWKSRGTYSKEVYCLNVHNKRWFKFVPLEIARAYHRTCALNGCLYTVGGGYTTSSISSTEGVDLSNGRTFIVGDLVNARSLMGISTYGNSIYVVAGINGEENLVTIERFDPREGKWMTLPGRTYGHGVCSSVVVKDAMYSVMEYGESFERFDFRMNRSTLIKPQHNDIPSDILSSNDKLYGVFNGHLKMYNPLECSWNELDHRLSTNSKYTSIKVMSINFPFLEDAGIIFRFD